jgi:membrane protein DedA with SNARE-associated domain
MNQFFKSNLRKFGLYTFLCVCIFLSLILLGFFITGNINMFEWDKTGRMLMAVIGTVLCISLIVGNEQ